MEGRAGKSKKVDRLGSPIHNSVSVIQMYLNEFNLDIRLYTLDLISAKLCLCFDLYIHI